MGSQWPKWLNECQYQLEALHSGVLAKKGLLGGRSGVYHVSSPGLHPLTRQTLRAEDVSRAAELQRQALQAEVEEIRNRRSRRGEISAHDQDPQRR